METMPVKYEDYFNEEFGFDVSSTARTTDQDSDLLLPEDLWKEFKHSEEFQHFDRFYSTYFDDIIRELSLDNPMDSLFAQVKIEEQPHDFLNAFNLGNCGEVMLHNHDCMWAGHCGSSEHPVEEPESKVDPKLFSPLTEAGGMHYNAPVVGKGMLNQAPSQQSLLKSSLRNAGVPVINMITPQTPPMSDDEEKQKNKKQTQVPKICSTSDEYDDTDQDLREYFDWRLDVEEEQRNDEDQDSSSSSSSSSSSESEDEEPQPGPSTSYPSSNVTSIRSNVYATENDHSYHKDKNATMRMTNLGIDTPSDSEEEIDVVSVSDKKYTAASRMRYALPTNPSVSDRRHLQRTMESAMSTGRRTNNSNGLKIMLPMKRQAASAPSCPPAKRKAAPVNENRANKRAKSYRTTNSTPYKKRNNYGHDSESEPEPSEKRSLHNNMERQRRIDLRNAFEYLRQLVPEVLKKERAAKVVILREAAKYCDFLTYNSMSMNKQLEDLKRHQERLRMRVSMLRRNLAQKR